jgi:23S rRNA (cytosine1962-C5)-methyltransferase
MAEQAPGLAFVERLENPPEFPDADPAGLEGIGVPPG